MNTFPFPTSTSLPSRLESSTQSYNAEIAMVLDSKLKNSGTNNQAAFLMSPAVSGILGVRLTSFSCYNLFPNVLSISGTNKIGNVFTVNNGGNVSATLTQGNYVCPTGTLTNVQVRAQDPSNDIRDVLIRKFLGGSAPADLLVSVFMDGITGRLTLTWNTSVTLVFTSGGNELTLPSQLGFTGSSYSGTSFTGDSSVNLGDPRNLAINISVGLENDPMISGQGTRENWLVVVPVTTPYSGMIYFEPYNSVWMPTRSRSATLTSFTVSILDPNSKMYLPMDTNQNWNLKLQLILAQKP